MEKISQSALILGSCTKHPIAHFLSFQKINSKYKTFVANLSNETILRNVEEALKDTKWKETINEEIKALLKNNTWEVVDLPKEKNTVGCKWVFTIKYKSDDTIKRYKTLLVTKGYTQSYGIDNQETFTPISKMNSIQVLLSLVANNDQPWQQLDVKNAFLHGNLEEVFIDSPLDFENHFGVGKVCKLMKSLYGLKQLPRAWFERFSRSIIQFGFRQS